jgi:hypothetical protein
MGLLSAFPSRSDPGKFEFHLLSPPAQPAGFSIGAVPVLAEFPNAKPFHTFAGNALSKIQHFSLILAANKPISERSRKRL